MKRLSILLAILSAACAPAPDPAEPVASATPVAPTPHAFQVQLTFTPRAAEKLVATKELVTIAGMYWGLPTAAAAPTADEVGQINLGVDYIDVSPENGAYMVPGSGFDDSKIESVDGAPQVLVNVYSARKTHADNLLNCGIYEGPIAMAQQRPVEIQCDLIFDENGQPYPIAP